MLTANVDVCGTPTPVRLRNLSPEGALIEGDSLPPVGSKTLFSRNDVRVESEVVWVEGRYAGLAFDQPLEQDKVLRSIPAPRERVMPISKRPGLACRPLTDYERRMLEQWMTSSPMGELGE